ncbi:unnamed protein product [Cylindrotheca closterium]|uniref:Uncharacterized protein n=1 Tax=Cylindrotheca closterium TaxID=2856 RepID=A0AAD2CRV8_9STRA|nr:unnamed protein product [Cylindrotheca closterium]
MSCWHDHFSLSKDSALVKLLEWITAYCPRQNYGIWLYTNTSVLLWSLLLLAELCMTDDPSRTRDRIEGTEAYLVYSFGVMLVWNLGAGLHLLDHFYVHQIVARWNGQGHEVQYCRPEERRLLNSCNKDNANDEDPEIAATNHEESTSKSNHQSSNKTIDLCAILFEFILSVYFLDYSRRAFRKWNTADKDVADEFLNTIINIGAFSYQVVRIWKIRQGDIARELAEMAAEEDSHDEHHADTEFEEVHFNTVYYSTWSIGNLHGLEIVDHTTEEEKDELLQGTGT